LLSCRHQERETPPLPLCTNNNGQWLLCNHCSCGVDSPVPRHPRCIEAPAAACLGCTPAPGADLLCPAAPKAVPAPAALRHSSSLSTFPLRHHARKRHPRAAVVAGAGTFRHWTRRCEAVAMRGLAAEAANPARLRRHAVTLVRRIFRTAVRKAQHHVRVQHFHLVRYHILPHQAPASVRLAHSCRHPSGRLATAPRKAVLDPPVSRHTSPHRQTHKP